MPKRILVVDDEEMIVRMLETNLKRAGYEVITAVNGRDGLEKAASDKPDLVLMDVQMPMMDGFAALEALKATQETSAIPVVMLTSKSQESDLNQGLDSGAEFYVTKPVDPHDLLGLIERLFASRE
jgi:DNA-binding response OmpR family regulator